VPAILVQRARVSRPARAPRSKPRNAVCPRHVAAPSGGHAWNRRSPAFPSRCPSSQSENYAGRTTREADPDAPYPTTNGTGSVRPGDCSGREGAARVPANPAVSPDREACPSQTPHARRYSPVYRKPAEPTE
jgi:hypothetical protein